MARASLSIYTGLGDWIHQAVTASREKLPLRVIRAKAEQMIHNGISGTKHLISCYWIDRSQKTSLIRRSSASVYYGISKSMQVEQSHNGSVIMLGAEKWCDNGRLDRDSFMLTISFVERMPLMVRVR